MAFSEQLKLKVRKKAHMTCCLCKSSIGVEVHHIVPQSEKGADTEANAAPLCPTCHETYGDNPKKRKLICESRDLWYEICQSRFSSTDKHLEDIKGMLKKTISYSDLMDFKSELLEHLETPSNLSRTQDEIGEALGEFFDKIWYNRHQGLKTRVDAGQETVDEKIWKTARAAAKKIESKYPKSELWYTDFEWGMLNGKMSALCWVLGDDWDMLDT
jgi:hypothetical protein